MAQTYDHRSGTAYRDVEYQVSSTGAATTVSTPGGIRYNGTAFQLLDAQGQYDPRTAFAAIHATLYDLAHLLAGGSPVLSGAVKTQTFYGNAFLNTETWWTSSAQTIKLSTHTYTYTTGNFANPSQEIWTLFDGTAANTVVRKVTDTMTYSGITETSRTRTVQ